MSLTKVNRNMVEVPAAGILGGTGIIEHENSFIIGNVPVTTANDTLFVNNIDADGDLNVDGNADIGVDLNVGGVISGDGSGLTNLPIVLTGGTVTSVGISGSDFVVTGSPVTDEGTIGLALANNGVLAGVYGNQSAIPSLTIDARGLITNATTRDIHSTIFSDISAVVGTISSTAGTYGSSLSVPSVTINSNGFVSNVSTYSISQTVSTIASTYALSARNEADITASTYAVSAVTSFHAPASTIASTYAVSAVTSFHPSASAISRAYALSAVSALAGYVVAPLTNGTVPAVYLPSYVDDVVEATNFAGLSATGETGKIYVTLDTNKTYRWSGSTYVEISPSPGSTDSVTEGSTNLYFTNTRANNAVSSSLIGTATPVNISATASVGTSRFYAKEDHAHTITSLPSGVRTTVLLENTTISATAATGSITFDVSTPKSVLYYTTAATAAFSLNFTSIAALLTANGDTVTVLFMNTTGATPYDITSLSIDGSAQTILWASGTTPSATASAINTYSFTIIRTAANTYKVLGSLTYFK
jgi:hypothetical protein